MGKLLANLHAVVVENTVVADKRTGQQQRF